MKILYNGDIVIQFGYIIVCPAIMKKKCERKDYCMRLDKYLADAGLGTRSECKKLVRKGHVYVNDTPANDPGMLIDDSMRIVYGGEPVLPASFSYYMFHKPAGCICATTDPGKTVLDYFPPKLQSKLFPIGRLDKDTEGLLLMTDDGMFAHNIISPRHQIPKLYYFEGEGFFDDACMQQLAEGMDIGDDKLTAPARIAYLLHNQEAPGHADPYNDVKHLPVPQHRVFGNYPSAIAQELLQKEPIKNKAYQTRGLLQITEGRFHQVKRMLKKCGVTVTYLKRLAIGDLCLDSSLAEGQYRVLTGEEIKMLGV